MEAPVVHSWIEHPSVFLDSSGLNSRMATIIHNDNTIVIRKLWRQAEQRVLVHPKLAGANSRLSWTCSHLGNRQYHNIAWLHLSTHAHYQTTIPKNLGPEWLGIHVELSDQHFWRSALNMFCLSNGSSTSYRHRASAFSSSSVKALDRAVGHEVVSEHFPKRMSVPHLVVFHFLKRMSQERMPPAWANCDCQAWWL